MFAHTMPRGVAPCSVLLRSSRVVQMWLSVSLWHLFYIISDKTRETTRNHPEYAHALSANWKAVGIDCSKLINLLLLFILLYPFPSPRIPQ